MEPLLASSMENVQPTRTHQWGIPEGMSLFPDEEEDVEKLFLDTHDGMMVQWCIMCSMCIYNVFTCIYNRVSLAHITLVDILNILMISESSWTDSWFAGFESVWNTWLEAGWE